jgi:hypothetical protein
MFPRVYHKGYCQEVLGIHTLPGSFFPRADPEELFGRARYHTTDTRLDPRVTNLSGERTKFSRIGKGDKLEVRVGVETRVDRKKVVIHLILREVKILETAQSAVSNRAEHLTLAGTLPVTYVDITRTI